MTGDHSKTPSVNDDALSDIKVQMFLKSSRDAEWARRWFSRFPMRFELTDHKNSKDAFSSNADILVIDAALKDSDGEFVLEKIASQRSGHWIVALCSGKRQIERARLLDSVDVLRKPFEWQFLAQRCYWQAERIVLAQQNRQQANALMEAEGVISNQKSHFKKQEHYETVTGLPSRKRFTQLVERGMSTVATGHGSLATIAVGFARISLIVEAMGQAHADKLVAGISDRLTQCLTEVCADNSAADGMRTAVVAHLGPAQFGVMLTWAEDDRFLDVVLSRLTKALSQPVGADDQSIFLSSCLGVSTFPQDADSADSLLQRADNALRKAQEQGGGICFHDAKADAAATRKLDIEHALALAIDGEQLTLAFQPIESATSGDSPVIEALIRWDWAQENGITTEEFVGIAEESALIVRLGQFVIDAACAQLRRWRRAGFSVQRICVNAAKAELSSEGYCEYIDETLKRHGLAAADLELELSERGVLSAGHGITERIKRLRELGVRISIDDFGTGDAAIAYLKNLPANVLKIDRSYIAGIPDNGQDVALTSGMMALGQAMGLDVVVEGVETQAQYELLVSMGCDGLQGYHICRPQSATLLEEHYLSALSARTGNAAV
ncbi:MAG: bifunctional diguanylate cyclase/phosphodiesterase [Pseudomonadota bacterium]